jgi:serine/threonine protein kinase
MADSSADRDPLDRLAEEFVARFRAGQRPSLTEFAERLPGRADEVRDLFPALVEMEQLKPATADGTGAFAPAAEPSDPVSVGEFRILRQVGRGGMGVVYEAVQESLGRHVALKLLPAEALADPRRMERFRREAKAAAKLHHTNIVPVFGTGSADGRHYFAMQFIDGHPLDAVIDEVRRLKDKSATREPRSVSEVAGSLLTGTFAPPADAPARPAHSGSSPSLSGTLSDGGRHYWATCARIAAQVADALAYAHGQGVLHRDIKPANLLLDLRGTVWVTDFGLAKSSDADDLTHAGDVVGTLRYMAPERFDGAGDHRADVYALGLTLYELLTLRPAFGAGNRAKLVQDVTAAAPPAPRSVNPSIPRDLETVVLKATARDPAMRYQSAAELANDLRRFVEDRPILARRATAAEQAWRWCRRNRAVASLIAAVLVVSVAGAGVASFFALRADAERGHADEQRRMAEQREREANEGKERLAAEQDRTQRLLYASQLNTATLALSENRAAQMLQVLEETTPRPGESDLRGWEWRYLNRLTLTDRAFPLEPDGLPVVSPRKAGWHFSANGRWLVRPLKQGEGFVYEVYDVAEGRRVARVPGKGEFTMPESGRSIPEPVISADGTHLVAAVARPGTGKPTTVPARIWNVQSGEEVPGPAEPLQFRTPASSTVVLDPGAARLAYLEPGPSAAFQPQTGPLDVTVARWDRASGRIARKHLRVGQGVGSPSLGPDGQTVYWSPSPNRQFPITRPQEANEPNVFECWDTSGEKPECRCRIPIPARTRRNTPSETVLSPAGTMVMVFGPRDVTVHRLPDGQVHWKTELPAGMPSTGLGQWIRASDDGNRLIFKWPYNITVLDKGNDGSVVTRRILFRSHVGDGAGSGEDSLTFRLLPDGKTLAALDVSPTVPDASPPGEPSRGMVIRLWDVSRDPDDAGPGSRNRDNLAPPVPGADGRLPHSVKSTHDGLTARWYSTAVPLRPEANPPSDPVHLFDARGDEYGTIAPPPGHTLAGVFFVADGRRLLVKFTHRVDPGKTADAAGRPGSVILERSWALYDIGTAGQPKALAGAAGECFPLLRSPYLLGMNANASASPFAIPARGFTLYDAAAGQEIDRRDAGPGELMVCFVDSYERTSGRFFVLTGQSGQGESVLKSPRIEAYEPAARRVVWSAELGESVAPTHAHFAFAPGGRRVVLESWAEGHYLLWTGRVADGGEARTTRAEHRSNTPRPFASVGVVHAFSPDGRLAVLVLGDEVQVWNLDTGERVNRLPGHPGRVGQAVFAPGGERMFVISHDPPGTDARLHVWDLRTDRQLLSFPTSIGRMHLDGDKLIVSGARERVYDGTPVQP